MAIENKNKVSNLAKDFGLQSKDILAILKQYTEGAKGHSQVLDDRELSIVFDALTLKNQVKIETIFAESYQEKKEEKPAPAPKAEQPKAAPAPAAAKPQAAAPAQQAQPAQQPKQNKSTATQQPTTRVPEKKIVDTRKNTNVNLDKYDEKLQDMAERSGAGRRDNMSSGKEKFRNQNKSKNANFSNKRKQEEAEKMRACSLRSSRRPRSRSRSPTRSPLASWLPV